jgi:uridine kinase
MSLGISSNKYPYSIVSSTQIRFGRDAATQTNGFRQALEEIARQHPQTLTKIDGDKVEKKTRRFLEKKAKNPNYSYMTGITGPTGSGKGSVVSMLTDSLEKNNVSLSKPVLTSEGENALSVRELAPKDGEDISEKIKDYNQRLTISTDHFFKDNSKRRGELGEKTFFETTNLDELPAYQLTELRNTVKKLKKGSKTENSEEVSLPLYSFHDSSSTPKGIAVHRGNFTVVEGIVVFAKEKFSEFMKEKFSEIKKYFHKNSPAFFALPFNLRKKFDLTLSVIVSDKKEHYERWKERWIAQGRGGDDPQGNANDTLKANWEKAWEGYKVLAQPFEKKAMLLLDNKGTKKELETVVGKIAAAMQKYLSEPAT